MKREKSEYFCMLMTKDKETKAVFVDGILLQSKCKKLLRKENVLWSIKSPVYRVHELVPEARLCVSFLEHYLQEKSEWVHTLGYYGNKTTYRPLRTLDFQIDETQLNQHYPEVYELFEKGEASKWTFSCAFYINVESDLMMYFGPNSKIKADVVEESKRNPAYQFSLTKEKGQN